MAILPLLRQIQSGDEKALLQLHEQYANLVYSVAYRIVGNQQDAEEVTQDVFMSLWHQSESFDENKGAFSSWLLTITRHQCIDRIRKQKRLPERISLDAEPHLHESLMDQDTKLEDRRVLSTVLDDLPHEQRETIELAYFYGMTHVDIAAYLKRPLGTVKSQIRLGMDKLRALWIETDRNTL